jgi:3-oxoacyl-[acyl-carrier protein] reductase
MGTSESKTIVVTGSASGIGLHLTGALLARGHRVLATDVNEEALGKQAEERAWRDRSVCLRKLDVRKAEDWEAALDEAADAWGRIDVLMHIAGVIKPGYAKALTPADIDLQVDVNVKGTMLGTRAAAARMVRAGGGHIINFGSLASLTPVPGLCVYSGSKFAVRGFSLAAATELLPEGVWVTVVMPDAVDTPMLDMQIDYEEAAMTFSGSKPLTVHDIERVILDKVLPERPLEVTLPLSRGVLARLANAAPAINRKLAPVFAKVGREKQQRIKKSRSP